jgi:D-inositol-3-phosphate glycosyltransferase
MDVALLTAGRDPHYAVGVARDLVSQQVQVDLIGGDALSCPEWDATPLVHFKNLKGDASEEASLLRKIIRIFKYYVKLVWYATIAKPKIFHILWNNKFETVDRVALMLLYKLLGKKVALTVHNVNMKTRDLNDSAFNRLTLNIQYRLTDHLFVHTELMKKELEEEFGVPARIITVIPFGINDAVPSTSLTSAEARQRLGIAENDRVLLFYGHIAPYKGMEFLLAAFGQIVRQCSDYRLIIAGKPKNCEAYWRGLEKMMKDHTIEERILQKIEHIPDDETEIYFKAADAFVLPYRHIYQSGVLFLGYNFGLPVIATDVGSLREDIIEGKTGFVCKPEDPLDLAQAIETYFSSNIFKDLNSYRQIIQEYARQRHSWDLVGQITWDVYAKLLGRRYSSESPRVV